MWVAASGVRFENIAVNGSLNLANARQCTVRNVSIIGAGNILATSNCWQCLFENIDLTQGSTSVAASASGGDYNIYKDFQFADGRGTFDILDTEQYPTLIGCKGDDTVSANVTYDLQGTRTTPVSMSACEGRFAATNEDFVITEVGRLVRQPEGLGTLEFDDDATRAATGPLALTGAAAAFDGATPQVIVDSVNERLIRAGDTMTGLLTMGANIVTDGTARSMGSIAGAATVRFDFGANILNVLGLATFQATATFDVDAIFKAAVLPYATAVQDLGSPTKRWNAVLYNLDVFNEVTTNLRPNVTGQDLGTAGSRWDLFAQQLDVGGTVDSSLEPTADGQDLGNVSEGWDLYARQVHYSAGQTIKIPISIYGPGAAVGGSSWTGISGAAASGGGIRGDTDEGQWHLPIFGLRDGDQIIAWNLMIYQTSAGGGATATGRLWRVDNGTDTLLSTATCLDNYGGPGWVSFGASGLSETITGFDSYYLRFEPDIVGSVIVFKHAEITVIRP